MFYKVQNFDNYLISKDGRLITLNYRATGKKKELFPKENEDGYLKYRLNKNKKRYQMFLHRLIAINFIPNPNNLPCINHIDGNKKNNSISNLEWCTHGDNMRHYWNKFYVPFTNGGINNAHSKLTEEQVREIKDIKNKSTSEIARMYGVSWNTIDRVIKNLTYKNVKT